MTPVTPGTAAEAQDARESRALVQFRQEVQQWCVDHIPPDWRETQTGASDEEFVAFQKACFAELHRAGFAVPHWPAEWGGGLRTHGANRQMSVAEQVVLYQELAAHDAPRLVLAFVGIHHAASTLLVAGTDEQRKRHLPAILDGEIWVQGFSEPEAGSDLASLRTTARKEGDSYVVNGQKLWASGGKHADWCLLLARTDPDAPKRKGISYFLLDMTTPGVEVRPIRNAIGDSHFCEIFLNDVSIPAANLIGAENAGWQVAQATLGAERGLTMLELAERLGNAGFRWLVQSAPVDDPIVADRLAQFETELTGLRALCRKLVEHSDPTPADASIVKLYYSELLQRMTDFATDIGGLTAHTELAKPMSSGWESGAWVLDFIGSWEWTIPGGASEIQRTIIGERGLGLPREPSAV
ncbi:acyl-CoA dehydrogenase [Mycolicibacterium sp. GF69]|uniref:acyl-CoA dehydrogenase family protein n=1 Tax=Mycolicibacterium sp. GF69 TaxID=2267251 RepID=UPI000DCE3B90|nr:acyl-CoA dehydrogenase family protein [Mycolicibacterium sp. GF69]RAV10953.1 acyl-CoA dehydrogenase [Mycolicibacterium sp. GF69]